MTSETKRSISIERATDIGMGLGEMVISSLAAYGCSKGVELTGKKTEELVRTFWETSKPVPTATPGRILHLAPADFINTQPVIQAIQACTQSGSNAAIAVGFTETLYQVYRHYYTDHTQSWGTDLIEGGYRGAAVGILTGFATNRETTAEKIASALVGAIIGSVVGNGIALSGYVARSIYLPKSK